MDWQPSERQDMTGLTGLFQSQSARTIIVPLDGSVQALAALPVARRLAEHEGAILHLVHVEGRMLPPRDLVSQLGLAPEHLSDSVLNQLTGTPAPSIVHEALERQSMLIVMCTRTGLAEPPSGMGPVAEEVVRLAPCPIVLVSPSRGLHPWMLRQILLPHDGTPTMAAAIHPALDLADRASADLWVLHVAAPRTETAVEPGTFAAPRYLDQPQHEWPAWTKEFLGRLYALGNPPESMTLHLSLAKGDPGDEIVRFASEHGSDLIVLAWRGHFEAERAATLKAVIQAAPCPVFILRVEWTGSLHPENPQARD